MNVRKLINHVDELRQELRDLDKKISWYDDIKEKLPTHIELIKGLKLKHSKKLSELSRLLNLKLDDKYGERR